MSFNMNTSPKQKAKELFEKFLPYVEAFSSEQQIENAKEAAIIVVDEMLEEISNLYGGIDIALSAIVEYWNGVKFEIQNI